MSNSTTNTIRATSEQMVKHHLTQIERKDSIDDLVENIDFLAEFDMFLSNEDVHLSDSSRPPVDATFHALSNRNE